MDVERDILWYFGRDKAFTKLKMTFADLEVFYYNFILKFVS